jgi:hypothetical protein
VPDRLHLKLFVDFIKSTKSNQGYCVRGAAFAHDYLSLLAQQQQQQLILWSTLKSWTGHHRQLTRLLVLLFS